MSWWRFIDTAFGLLIAALVKFPHVWLTLLVVMLVGWLDDKPHRRDCDGESAAGESVNDGAASTEKPIGYIHLDAYSRSGKGRVATLEEARAKIKQRASERLDKPLTGTEARRLCKQLMANIEYLRQCDAIVVEGSHTQLVISFMSANVPWAASTRWLTHS